MKWLLTFAAIYISYYTINYAILVWKKERNGLAVVFITILSIAITAIPIYTNFIK